MMIKEQEISIKINKKVFIFSCLEWILFFVSANFIALVVMIFWSKMNTLAFVGFGLCCFWMLIARFYKGAINAYKESNKEIINAYIEELKSNNKI